MRCLVFGPYTADNEKWTEALASGLVDAGLLRQPEAKILVASSLDEIIDKIDAGNDVALVVASREQIFFAEIVAARYPKVPVAVATSDPLYRCPYAVHVIDKGNFGPNACQKLREFLTREA